MLQEMFHQIDCNGEGSVTWDDFTTFLTLTGKYCHYVRAYPRNTYFYLLLNPLELFLFVSMNQAILHFIQYDVISCKCSIDVMKNSMNFQGRIKCPINMNEYKVEMVISTELKTCFRSLFWTFYSVLVI